MAKPMKHNNPPAFPSQDDQGISTLDWFAGKVLSNYGIATPYRSSQIAKSCYRIAVAMLKEKAAIDGQPNTP